MQRPANRTGNVFGSYSHEHPIVTELAVPDRALVLRRRGHVFGQRRVVFVYLPGEVLEFRAVDCEAVDPLDGVK